MRLRDREKSVIALHFIYVAYRTVGHTSTGGGKHPYRMEVHSANEHQYFHYSSEIELNDDLKMINKWILSREI